MPDLAQLKLAAQWIRRELATRADGSHPSHLAAKLLDEADTKFNLRSYGAEGYASSPTRGFQYLNYGDTYDPTIVIVSTRHNARVSVARGGWAPYA